MEYLFKLHTKELPGGRFVRPFVTAEAGESFFRKKEKAIQLYKVLASRSIQGTESVTGEANGKLYVAFPMSYPEYGGCIIGLKEGETILIGNVELFMVEETTYWLRSFDEFLNWVSERERIRAWRDSPTSVKVYPPIDAKPPPRVLDALDPRLAVGSSDAEEPRRAALNPQHYQHYFVHPEYEIELQWIETMSGIMPSERFEGALELQVVKYIARLGKKDTELQELGKALWYLKFWIAYIANGRKLTLVKDVEELIKK